MSHGSVAAKVRAHKLANPHLYCSASFSCLWRTQTARGFVPCRRHGANKPRQSLYDELVLAGARIENDGADLLTPVNTVTTILVGNHPHGDGAETFTNPDDGQPWYNVPGAYEPEWGPTGYVAPNLAEAK